MVTLRLPKAGAWKTEVFYQCCLKQGILEGAARIQLPQVQMESVWSVGGLFVCFLNLIPFRGH